MNSERVYPNLYGKRIFIAETGLVAKTYRNICEREQKMMAFAYATLPSSWGESLASYMRRTRLNCAILHDVYSPNFQEIIDAHQNGIPLVVLTKVIVSDHDSYFYESLKEKNVPCLVKQGVYLNAFYEALAIISGKFSRAL